MYLGEETVCFEEFDDKDWPITDMLVYLDKYECILNCRYQNKYAAWTRVFIITNMNPTSLYQLTPDERRDAFFRRIHYTCEVTSINQVILL